MSVFREIRVIPVVLVAVFSLAVLKGANLIINGGYVFDYQPDSSKRSWAQEAFNFPGAAKSESGDFDALGELNAKLQELLDEKEGLELEWLEAAEILGE